MIAGCRVLVVEARAYTQVKSLIAFFLSWTFLKSWTFSSKSELDNLLLVVIASALAAHFNYALHITTFGTYESSGYLKLFIIVYLNVKAACVFNIIIVVAVICILIRVTNSLYSIGNRQLLIVDTISTLGTSTYLLCWLKWCTLVAHLLRYCPVNLLHTKVCLGTYRREGASVSKRYLTGSSWPSL